MKIDGFGISGYRSFSDGIKYIKDLSKVNIFIGKNNSGKSNVLRFCEHISKFDLNTPPYQGLDKNLDFCKDSKENDIQLALQIRKDSSATGGIYKKISEILPNMKDKFSDWDESIWFKYSFNDLSHGKRASHIGVTELAERIKSNYNENVSDSLAGRFLGGRGNNHHKRCFDLARMIYEFYTISFNVKYIEAFRKITHDGDEENAINGSGLIIQLRKLQKPTLNNLYEKSKEKFELINSFLRELIGEETAFIEIPAEVNDIYVSIKNKILPLDSLGTGIHELIILAAAVTLVDDIVFCIEEPEIHIHPGLQKRFIKYLIEKTNNQYLLTTHSNAFLDIPGINLYHCRLINKSTECELVVSNKSKYDIISDLGYKPSDLLQSNFIIWVEGPSDRIYLNHWIHEKSPQLIENLHYSVMFYGGRLLSHLTYVNDPEVQGFVQLSKLNHNAAIVIDSDKKTLQARLNATKKRVIDNFEKNGCFVWVTNGKEIENYLSEDLYNQALEKIHPRKSVFMEWGRFNNLTKLKDSSPIDKVAIAKFVSEQKSDYSILDLEKQINNLIQRIEESNL